MQMFTPRTILLIFFLQIALSPFSQPVAPQWASIKAFLPRWEGADVTITINKNPVYKGKVRNGMVSFNYQLTGISEASIEVKNERSAHSFFFAEPGVIRITDDGRILRAFGTASNDQYSNLEKDLDSLARVQTNGSAAAVKQMKMQNVADLVKTQSDSYVSLRMLYQYYYGERNANDTLYYRLYNSLSPELRSTHWGMMIGQEVKSRYKIAIGREAPSLFVADTKNVMQPVYQKGQYTLIHFWASWCQPCRTTNRWLKDVQNDLPPDILTLVGISLDGNYSSWTNAIKNEKLSWKQLSDLKGWSGEVANSYSVEAIPSNILVDPNGIIIARNVSADDLKKLIGITTKKTF